MTPVERAAEALSERYKADKRTRVADARAAFESIDPVGLSQVIHKQIVSAARSRWIDIEVHDPVPSIDFERTIGRAVRDWLLQEEE